MPGLGRGLRASEVVLLWVEDEEWWVEDEEWWVEVGIGKREWDDVDVKV